MAAMAPGAALLGIITAGTGRQALFKKAGEELQAVLVPGITKENETPNTEPWWDSMTYKWCLDDIKMIVNLLYRKLYRQIIYIYMQYIYIYMIDNYTWIVDE